MGVAAETETWLGRPVRRLEDEALLRGEGRFIDDLAPVPHAGHAAVLRSLLAHARIARLDVSAALELPGVIGVLTGADVAAMSRPFPVGVDGARPYYAAAADVARYAGRAARCRCRPRPLHRRGRARADRRRVRAARAGSRPRGGRDRLRSQLHLRRPGRRVRAGRPRSSRRLSTSLAGAALRSSATASSPTGTRRRDR